MRRIVVIVGAIVLAAALVGPAVAAGPTSRVNRLVANFEILDWDRSVVGHIVANFKEPTTAQVVPGHIDITWVAGARFPYQQHEYGIDESHTLLTGSFFGLGDPNPGGQPYVVAGATGSMCDYAAPWNAICHEFAVVFERDVDPAGTDLIGFSTPSWDNTEFYLIGNGSFVITYAGPTGS